MNDPKSEDSEKSCENKSGEERERRENKQSEPFVCLYLTAATDGASVRPRKISGEEKRERERERKGKPEEEEVEEERHFNDGWLTFASLARRERASSCCPQASKSLHRLREWFKRLK